MLTYLVYLLTGALGGIIIGALGSGSSLVILPLLSFIFSHIFPHDIAIKAAVATCLAALVVGSASGAASYYRKGFFNTKLIMLCLPGVLAGAVIAPLTTHLLPAAWLKWYIGLFLILIALYKLWNVYKGKWAAVRPVEPVLIVLMSMVSATLSGMAGVALGILMIPFLSRYTDHHSVLGTNLIVAVPYSIIGSAGYVVSGLQVHDFGTNWMAGYVFLPAFLTIAVTMAIFPPLGLKLVQNVKPVIVQNIFYLYLLLAGIGILV
ncbi:sulfite exporter TauE/SafE family protein [Endozoicomonas ascidiicola]|uniref:sulfite exporter TauE/SafE family protein n=1 Tax=Endozoicomonas ascidiicola TaxID=1698521 RepID=UPI000AF75A0F|nr:sulfite exporter TauE/SafE family protein [Endozoicomonas ascidiicola]